MKNQLRPYKLEKSPGVTVHCDVFICLFFIYLPTH